MSGLCDAHTHFSWNDAPSLNHLGTTPPEDHTVFAVKAARTYIDMGYTMCVGASSAKIAPRRRDPRRDKRRHDTGSAPSRLLHRVFDPEGTLLPGASIVVSGPASSARPRAKSSSSGSTSSRSSVRARRSPAPCARTTPTWTEEELAAVVEVAHARGRKVSVHARSTESIKAMSPGGHRFLVSCKLHRRRGLDLLEARKDRVFVAPGVNWIITTLHDAAPWGYASLGGGSCWLCARARSLRGRNSSHAQSWHSGIAGWRLRLCVVSARNLRARFEALRRSLWLHARGNAARGHRLGRSDDGPPERARKSGAGILRGSSPRRRQSTLRRKPFSKTAHAFSRS